MKAFFVLVGVLFLVWIIGLTVTIHAQTNTKVENCECKCSEVEIGI